MEDKWFIYWKDDALFFHRSWTGLVCPVGRRVALMPAFASDPVASYATGDCPRVTLH